MKKEKHRCIDLLRLNSFLEIDCEIWNKENTYVKFEDNYKGITVVNNRDNFLYNLPLDYYSLVGWMLIKVGRITISIAESESVKEIIDKEAPLMDKVNFEKLDIEDTSVKPKIITIIGSTRYIDEISIIAWSFEKLGNIVFTPRLLPSSYIEKNITGSHIAESEGVKEIIDKVYLDKVRMADVVYVVNIDNYIGESTQKELELAKKLRKKIVYHKELKEKK